MSDWRLSVVHKRCDVPLGFDTVCVCGGGGYLGIPSCDNASSKWASTARRCYREPVVIVPLHSLKACQGQSTIRIARCTTTPDGRTLLTEKIIVAHPSDSGSMTQHRLVDLE